LHHRLHGTLAGRLNYRIAQRVCLVPTLSQDLGQLRGGRIRGNCTLDCGSLLPIRCEQIRRHENERFRCGLEIHHNTVRGACRRG
jgi:hypothetical protein